VARVPLRPAMAGTAIMVWSAITVSDRDQVERRRAGIYPRCYYKYARKTRRDSVGFNRLPSMKRGFQSLDIACRRCGARPLRATFGQSPTNLFATLAKGKQLPISIDVVQDTVCPWCRIGKKNLDDALSHFEGETPEVMFHPFFLHPGMPPAGRSFRDHMRTVKGDDDIGPMLIRVSNAGLQAGLKFDWDKIQRAPNTLLSHALVLSAPVEEQGQVLDVVHKAYFENGIDIGDKQALIDLTDGLPVDVTKLDDDAFLDAVAGRAEMARGQGVSGVPFFIFNHQFSVSGAQPPSVLLDAMEKAAG
jgi:predicted DsbA family dithiol-disulfide isomerase